MNDRTELERFHDVLELLKEAQAFSCGPLPFSVASYKYVIELAYASSGFQDDCVKGLSLHIVEKCTEHDSDQSLFDVLNLAIEYVKITLWFAGDRRKDV